MNENTSKCTYCGTVYMQNLSYCPMCRRRPKGQNKPKPLVGLTFPEGTELTLGGKVVADNTVLKEGVTYEVKFPVREAE